MNEYFPKPTFFGGKVKFELGLSYYATKSEIKNGTSADTSKFAKKLI